MSVNPAYAEVQRINGSSEVENHNKKYFYANQSMELTKKQTNEWIQPNLRMIDNLQNEHDVLNTQWTANDSGST